MDAAIPWARLLELFAEHYSYRVTGRPRTHLEFMLRCHLVGLFYNLSGEGLTDALNDSEAFKRFIRLGLLEADVPEETTLRNFRYLIEEKDLSDSILRVVNESLVDKGLKMSHGTLVDATIITASSSTKNQDKQRDPQMGSTKKNNNWHFGLKIHVGEDAEANLVHHVEVTAANESDVGQSNKLLRETDQAGLGDKGYQRSRYRGSGVVYSVQTGKLARSDGGQAQSLQSPGCFPAQQGGAWLSGH